LHRKPASAAISRYRSGAQWSTEIKALCNEHGIASLAAGFSPFGGLLSTLLAVYLGEANTKAPQLNIIYFKAILLLYIIHQYSYALTEAGERCNYIFSFNFRQGCTRV
jgi:hypothetical protein